MVSSTCYNDTFKVYYYISSKLEFIILKIMKLTEERNTKIRQKCKARNHSEFQNLKKKVQSRTTRKYCKNR